MKKRKTTRKKKQSSKRLLIIKNRAGQFCGTFSKDTTIASCWGCGFDRVVPNGIPADAEIQLDDKTRARIKAKADALETVVALDPKVIAARKKLVAEYANAQAEYEKTKAETLRSARFRDAVQAVDADALIVQAHEMQKQSAQSLSDRMISAWHRMKANSPDADVAGME